MSPNEYAVLTPYLIPEMLRTWKIPNLGDGFILNAIERQMGPFADDLTFPARKAPPAGVESAKGIILGGANLLDDNFAPWPGISADEISALNLPIIPFGIGLHGDPDRNVGFSADTCDILRAIHEKIGYSSWRCPLTVDLLIRALPDLEDKFLMTGCPVVYDAPLLEGTHFHDKTEQVAVTVTERGAFWNREKQTIDFVADRFRNARKHLVLHQDYSPQSRLEAVWQTTRRFDESWSNPYQKLRWYARKRGFHIVSPKSSNDCFAFYQNIDLHFGSRLHAHLHLLSQNKRSFLTGVDNRASGIALSLGFPICEAENFDAHLEFDFEIVRTRARALYKVMTKFLESLQ